MARPRWGANRRGFYPHPSGGTRRSPELTRAGAASRIAPFVAQTSVRNLRPENRALSSDAVERSDPLAVRRQKLEEIRGQGVPVWPERYERTHRIHEALALAPGTKGLRLAGRLMLRRQFGKLTFAHIQDIEGRIQIAIERSRVGEEAYASFARQIDIGDFVGVTGELFRTRTGELTLNADSFVLLGKALRPLPEKFHGLQDLEAKSRQRYLDLITNEDGRRRALLRSRLVRSLRRRLEGEGFIEVETPILQTKPSGALATPFATHHKALDLPLYLRIAPETYLKRLIVGGFDRIFELGRCFRNEGMDASHLQDFTMLEYYCAYWNYEDNMRFTEAFLPAVVEEVLGTREFTFRGERILFDPPWPRIALEDLIREHAGIETRLHPDADSLRAIIREKGIEIDGIETLGRGALIDGIYKKTCREKLVQPTFLVRHPVDLSPLARRSDDDPTVADRFQLAAGGWEIVNAYSELVDPIDQRERLAEQARLRAQGDEEAMPMDEDYLTAMEYGMPPISGWGMGVDRFACMLAGEENLREVVLFPLLRPIEGESRAPSE